MSKLNNKILTEISHLTGSYSLPPSYVSLLTTFKCNFRCASCSVWQKNNHQELDEAAWLKIAEDLKINLPKNTVIEINGGEALLETDKTVNLIRNLSNHFNSISLNSNGSLINSEIIKKLEAAGLTTLKISLYSLDESTHDALRGFLGAQQRVLSALSELKNSKLKIEIGILLTAQNIRHLPDLIKFVNQLPSAVAIIQPLDESVESIESKNLHSNNLPSDLWPKAEDVAWLFDWLDQNPLVKNPPIALATIKKYYLNPASSLNYRCFAGQKNLIVYPNGDTTFCFKSPKFGNLSQNSFKTIMSGAAAKTNRLLLKNCPKYCRIIGCNFNRGFLEIIKGK